MMLIRISATSRHLTLTRRLQLIPHRCYAKISLSHKDLLPGVPKSPTSNGDTPSVDATKVDLPSEIDWRKHFPSSLQINHRVSIRNAATAAKVADAFVPSGSRDKVIIEAFPGPGQLTRALLDLPKERIRKLIVMEDWEPYLQYLRPLELKDPRIKVIDRDGYAWDSYQLIHAMQLLDDVPIVKWEEGVHPQLQFISHLPSTVMGEQLLAQLFRLMPDKQWLFQYGRVPLSFLLTENIFKRATASVKDKTMRCKVSVVAEAVAKCSEPLPHTDLQPFEDHFHPKRLLTVIPADRKKNSRAVGHPFHTLNIVPNELQIIKKGQMDAWDYCLRRLFVRKATSLKEALPGLAPGAATLIKRISDSNLPDLERVDVKKAVRMMTINDWNILLEAFDEWPFSPEDLSIGDTFSMKERMG